MSRVIDRLSKHDKPEAAGIIAALQERPATISPKYLYDAQGCALFAAICELEEYYPTRTEQAIFDQHRGAIAEIVGRRRQLIDLGAGDGRKAQQWFPVLEPSRYLAVDIAPTAVRSTLDRIASECPALEAVGLLTDFADTLTLPDELVDQATLFFYPGSSIGNFAPSRALHFLAALREHCTCAGAGSGLLIGVDAKKDPVRLAAAYDDALGVTAAFNRNVLRHLNALIGSDFDARAFAHRALYNAQAGRIEMHLEATTAQTVRLGSSHRRFEAGERIATEHSYKYAPEEFEALLRQAGFASIRCWRDEASAFLVFYASLT